MPREISEIKFFNLSILNDFTKILKDRLNRTVISAARNVEKPAVCLPRMGVSAHFLWGPGRSAVRDRLGNTYPPQKFGALWGKRAASQYDVKSLTLKILLAPLWFKCVIRYKYE